MHISLTCQKVLDSAPKVAGLPVKFPGPLRFLLMAVILISALAVAPAWPQFGQRPQVGQIKTDKITAGLKEALKISTSKAIASTGRPDGFLKNEAIKILLPERLRSAGKGLRMVGMGTQVDALEVGMNRAAEQAVPAAKQIFLNALTRMTFQDARQILHGSDIAATEYFKSASSDQLAEAFLPIVHKSMENVGVIRQYNKLMQNPMAGQLAGNDRLSLDKYVVGKTLDGLFYVMGEEEKRIRKDPLAQTTSLLKEVFGKSLR
jgi:Protein of unknown function (DUF4197)